MYRRDAPFRASISTWHISKTCSEMTCALRGFFLLREIGSYSGRSHDFFAHALCFLRMLHLFQLIVAWGEVPNFLCFFAISVRKKINGCARYSFLWLLSVTAYLFRESHHRFSAELSASLRYERKERTEQRALSFFRPYYQRFTGNLLWHHCERTGCHRHFHRGKTALCLFYFSSAPILCQLRPYASAIVRGVMNLEWNAIVSSVVR